MKNLNALALASGALLCLLGTTPSFAQDDSEILLDEIVITGRNREETLQDVPVSTSVISETLIEDAGITDLYDLFEMVPGLHYDEEGDRLAALPSIRGIQANDVAPNRTKVSSFIDGIPVLGSQGSIGFNGFQQVEVYRGPQSAAFGRSTFAGAINYVTRDPGDEFEGSVGVNVSDYGTRTANLSVGGPITDNLGFLLNYQKEDSGSPDEFHANGDYGTNLFGLGQNNYQSDGLEYGSRSGDNFSGKLVFQPDDTLKVSMTFNHVKTDDLPSVSHYLSEEARNECLEKGALFASEGMMAPYLVGEMDCDWDNVRDTFNNHDIVGFIEANPDFLAYLVDSATNPQDVVIMGMGPGAMDTIIPAPAAAAPVTINGVEYSVEEQILLMAQAFSIPDDKIGTESERNRFTFQVDKLLDSGSAIQFSYMQSDEEYLRAYSTNTLLFYDPDVIGVVDDGDTSTFFDNAPGPQVLWADAPANPDLPADPAGTHWYFPTGMAAPGVANPSVGDIKEQYAELRWVSPAEDRLRYVVGASYYDYEFIEARWGNMDADQTLARRPLAYGAYLNDIVDEYMVLSGHAARGTLFVADNEVIADNAQNAAAYFNIGYDLTDRLTLSAEGRYQSDTVGASNLSSGLAEEVTTTNFVPRVSLTFDLNENTSYYLQWAQGVNPRGINNALLQTNTLDVINNGISNGLIPFSAALNSDTYNNSDFSPVPDGIVDAYDDQNDIWYTDDTRTTLLSGNNYQSGFSQEDFTTYDEEQITQIEFGFKGNLLDGRLTYAGALYSIDWKDQLQNGSIDIDSPCADNGDAGNFIGTFDLETLAACSYEGQDYFWVGTTAGSTINTSLNFGDVKIKGAEIESNYRITDNWDIRAQASVMDATYDQFCDIAAYAATEFDPNDPVDAAYLDEFNIRIRESGENGSVSETCYVTDGNEVASQPRFSASLSPSFNTDIGGMRLNARLDLRHEGKQWSNSINYQYYPAVTTANLSVGLSGDQWSATLYVNNLTEENSPTIIRGGGDNSRQMGLIGQDLAYEFQGYLGETIPGSEITRDNFNFQPRLPRTIGLRASYRF